MNTFKKEIFNKNLYEIDIFKLIKKYIESLKIPIKPFDYDEDFKSNIVVKDLESYFLEKKYTIEKYTNYEKSDENTSKEKFFVSNINIKDNNAGFCLSRSIDGTIRTIIYDTNNLYTIHKELSFNIYHNKLFFDFHLYSKEINFAYIINNEFANNKTHKFKDNEINKAINEELKNNNNKLEDSFFEFLNLKYDIENNILKTILQENFSGSLLDDLTMLNKDLKKITRNNNKKLKI